MQKGKIIDFQKIRRKTQIKDCIAFQIYLKNIFNELAIRLKTNNEKILNKLSFIKYMKIPFILGEKIFNSLDKDQKGHLIHNEFMHIMNLYIGDLEEVQMMIFNILDFDRDGIIIPEDTRLLLTFIKKIGQTIKSVVKLKIKLKKEATDEENLKEIDELITNFFNGKPNMTYDEYKHNIDKINSDVFFVFIYYLYVNKPFSESSVKVLKMLNNTNRGSLQNSFSSSVSSSGTSDNGEINEIKSTLTGGSKTLKSFIKDLIDVDVDDIENGCIENNDKNNNTYAFNNNTSSNNNLCTNNNTNLYDINNLIDETNYEDYLLTQLTERKNNIHIPNSEMFKDNISIAKLKGNLDFISPNQNNLSKITLENIKNHIKNYKKLDKNNILENYDNDNNNKNDKENLEVFKEISIKTKNNMQKNMEIKNQNFNDKGVNYAENKKNQPLEKLKSEEYMNDLKIQTDLTEKKKDNHNKDNKLNLPISIKNANENFEANLNSKKEELNFNFNKNSNDLKIQIDQIKIIKSEDEDNPPDGSKLFNYNQSNIGNFNLYENEFLINPADILYEGYIYKTRNGDKLRKYYLGIIGTDLVYFTNSKKTKLKGMHNLTGTYILEEDNITKLKRENETEENVQINILYQFTLIFNKKKRNFFCEKEEEVKNWIKNIKKAINLKDINDYYEFKNKIGEGKFGLVKGGIDKRNGEKVAIKTIDKSKIEGIEMEMVMSEYEIMSFCKHPNIVKCFDQFEDYKNIYIVLEYLSGGTLVKFLSFQDSILTEKKIKEIILQIAKGINYMHYFGILHRDLKPENLMMTSKEYENSQLKIVDFGLSKVLGIREKTDEGYGTLSFAAPEVIQNLSYTNIIDVWSIGVILYFLVTGHLPFSSKNKNFEEVKNDIVNARVYFDQKYWNRLSPFSKDLVKKSLEKQPYKRIKINEFIEHQWFKE